MGPKKTATNSEDLSELLPRLPIRRRVFLSLTGVILPAICIASGLQGGSATGMDPWQSGSTEDYVLLFLQMPGLLPFLPFIAYSMVSLALTVCRPRMMDYFLIRFGLYTGAILAGQFLIAVLVTSHIPTLIAAIIAGPCLMLVIWLASIVVSKFHRFSIKYLLVLTAITAILLSLVMAMGRPMLAGIFIPLLMLFVASPALNFVAYTMLAVFVAANHSDNSRSRWIPIAAIVAWLTGFFFAWRGSIERVLEEYQNLPTTNPNCYVSSAAAHGSPALVRSRFVISSHGTYSVNLQMKRLKFLEFVFQTAAPRSHRNIRSFYNVVGPRMAAFCRASRLAANLTFLFLIPVELLAETIRRTLRIPSLRVEQIYEVGDCESPRL